MAGDVPKRGVAMLKKRGAQAMRPVWFWSWWSGMRASYAMFRTIDQPD